MIPLSTLLAIVVSWLLAPLVFFFHYYYCFLAGRGGGEGGREVVGWLHVSIQGDKLEIFVECRMAMFR